MSKSSIAILTLTAMASAVVAQARFVTSAGAYPAAGGLPLGVTRSEGEVGDPIPVDVLGTTLVEAGDAIAADTPLMVTATGKVVAHDGDGDKHAVGRSLEAASADGELLEILLVPTTGLLVTAA
jgi:hypothetical protein